MPPPEFVEAWQDIFWPNEPVARLIDRGAQSQLSYTLLLGSNTNILHSTHYRRQFASTLNLFDRLVLSHDVGRMKPSSEFYHACVRGGGRAGRVHRIFVDDLAGKRGWGSGGAGLIGHYYINTPALITDLTELGVKIAASGE